MSDAVVVGSLVLSSAVLATVHVSIAYSLCFRPPRWRAAVAFVVPPVAAYLAFSERMTRRAVVWCVAAVLYAIARALASA